jgi:hypothetical protein
MTRPQRGRIGFIDKFLAKQKEQYLYQQTG